VGIFVVGQPRAVHAASDLPRNLYGYALKPFAIGVLIADLPEFRMQF
jgi:hypothetical protein